MHYIAPAFDAAFANLLWHFVVAVIRYYYTVCVVDVQTSAVSVDVLGRLRQKTQVMLKLFTNSLNE